MKESEIENTIKEYIRLIGGFVQRLHSGRIITKRGPMTYALHLADKGCPDLIACVKGKFYGIEVKADDIKKKQWKKLQVRYKSGELLPKSYHREMAQMEQADNIVRAGGEFILASCLEDVMEIIK